VATGLGHGSHKFRYADASNPTKMAKPPAQPPIPLVRVQTEWWDRWWVKPIFAICTTIIGGLLLQHLTHDQPRTPPATSADRSAPMPAGTQAASTQAIIAKTDVPAKDDTAATQSEELPSASRFENKNVVSSTTKQAKPSCEPGFGVATTSNGFQIRFHHHRTIRENERLFITTSDSGYVDIPRKDIADMSQCSNEEKE